MLTPAGSLAGKSADSPPVVHGSFNVTPKRTSVWSLTLARARAAQTAAGYEPPAARHPQGPSIMFVAAAPRCEGHHDTAVTTVAITIRLLRRLVSSISVEISNPIRYSC